MCGERIKTDSEAEWNDWRWQERNALCTPDPYPMRVTPYYMGLMKDSDRTDPIYLQAVPTASERAENREDRPDPIGDRALAHRPAASVIHRYADRVLFVPTWECAVNCRFCFRRERFLREGGGRVSAGAIEEGLEYIAARNQIHEVILTGGDPLTLSDDALLDIVGRLAAIGHVRLLRIHTRMPVVNPFRIDPALCRALASVDRPLWLVTQFNHPVELTDRAREGIAALIGAGIPVLNQSVLLKGVNDRTTILRELFVGLAAARIKPYYLHHPDKAAGTAHFRISLRRGIELFGRLRGTVPGYALPHYVLDIPGGFGKVPLEQAGIRPNGDGSYRVTAPDGSTHTYRDDDRG